MSRPVPRIVPVLAEDGTQAFSAEGHGLTTRVWPANVTLADAGWQEMEEPMSAVERVEAIAKARGITFDEAALTPEGKEAYQEYMEHERAMVPQSGGQTGNRTGDRLARRFAGDGETVQGVEAELETRVDALLEKEGKHTPTDQDRAEAVTRIATSDPDLYQRYVEAQRQAIGR